MPTLRQTMLSAACLLGALVSVPTAWAAAPVFTSSNGATAVYLVDENATAITTLTAHDDDNDTLVFTIAGGADQVYPPQHGDLYAAIRERGLIVSERPLGRRATAQDFPRRNRIITGLSVGTVIVEAAERSGSLISARMAGEQGREVMAVPGSPLDRRAAGTNRLLREGATLIRHGEDVLEAISSQIGVSSTGFHPVLPLDPPDRPDVEDTGLPARILEALSPTPLPIAEIARASGCSARQCAACLMELELEGRALTHTGGLASRV